jgi:hypothetical protein
MQQARQENTYRTPLQRWIETLNVFDNDIEQLEKEDDTLFLIKQYARLQLSSIKQLRADYKQHLKTKCPIDLLRNEIILSIMEKIQDDLSETLHPGLLPADVNPIDFNEEVMGKATRGAITRLVEGTVLERTYNGKTYAVYYRNGHYEYNQQRFDSLTEVARDITGTLCSGPTFFSRKVKMYIL